MALTIKRLNSSFSFLVTFEPLGGNVWSPFRILLDPVPNEPSNDIVHSESSSTLNGQQACMSSLRDMPEPDLTIITQNRSSHLNEATLRQFAPGGTRMLILAEASAAKTIRNWKYFDDGIVQTLPLWEDSRHKGIDAATRLAVSPCYFGGDEGEVTISLIPQKKDVKGVNSAIGITYRPPPSRPSIFRRPVPTPPTTPTSTISSTPPQLPPYITDSATRPFTARIVPPTPPDSPLSQPLGSVRLAASLPSHTYDRTLSVIFSPHGTSYSSLEPYATSHLVSEAALPLTALLHPFNAELTSWWLVANAGAGAPVGQETALALGARAWLNTAYTKDQQQMVTRGKRSRCRVYSLNEVQRMLDQAEGKEKRAFPSRKSPKPTEILDLGLGEEVALTSEGLWEAQSPDTLQKDMGPDALGVFHNIVIG